MTRLIATLACCLVALCSIAPARADASSLSVTVADPFISLHTGPGRGYPVTLVVVRGERVEVLKRRTAWFKVRDARGREGWVHRDEMALTLTDEGASPGDGLTGRTDFTTQGRETPPATERTDQNQEVEEWKSGCAFSC